MKFDEELVLSSLNEAWSWSFERAAKVLAVNSMGNCLIKDWRGQYWRVCPENLSAKVVAQDDNELRDHFADPNSKADWQLAGLIGPAAELLGELDVGQCYAMTTPAVLGAEYSVSNLKIRSLYEYLGFAGYAALQIKQRVAWRVDRER
jgi:hypothetical protein